MKKHYIRITVIITSLILVAFILAGGFFTYTKAQDVIDNRTKSIEFAEREFELSDISGRDGNIYSVLRHTYFVSVFLPDDIGVYTDFQVGSDDIRSGDYCSVSISRKVGEDFVEDERIMLMDESFDCEEHYMFSVKIDAKCDDFFIFDGTFSYSEDGWKTSTSYPIPDNPAADHKNCITVEEWGESADWRVETIRLNDSAKRRKLNREAEETCKTFLGNISKEGYGLGKQSIFTRYSIFSKSNSFSAQTRAGGYSIYVYHPVNIVLSKYLGVYIFGFIALLAIEAGVILLMRKLYGNRLAYDLQRQSMTRSLAHDLKTPLAVTKAYVENWEYIDEKDRPEYAAKLTAEVDNMAKMINDLLNLSKMEEGNRNPKLEDVDLYALGKALFEQMQPLISERQLKAEFLPGENIGKYIVNADLEMMRTAIGNFLTNAVKYAKSQVRVRLTDDGKTVTFRVSNDGDQIPKKDAKRVWDVFYKGDKARTDRFKSSGLGLAFCKTIFETHKARYGCTSGTSMTSFWFTQNKAKDSKK